MGIDYTKPGIYPAFLIFKKHLFLFYRRFIILPLLILLSS